MKKNGIVGVGDICNTTDTLFQKKFKNLAYYNFIEIFDVNEERINKRIKFAISLRSKFREIGMMATIVPHAPYSVTPKLMKEIINQCDKKDYISTIHLQENPEENLLFSSKKGQFFNWLNDIGSSPEIWEKRNSSIDILDEFLSNNVLAVHNTFTSKSELRDIYYCTCPKANLYIENSLPDYSIFNTEKLCVGTDSLASNTNLCIFEELKIIRNKSNFDFNTLLKIGSKNGAEALGFRHLGTFERGKKPGVNLIKNFEKVEVII